MKNVHLAVTNANRGWKWGVRTILINTFMFFLLIIIIILTDSTIMKDRSHHERTLYHGATLHLARDKSIEYTRILLH